MNKTERNEQRRLIKQQLEDGTASLSAKVGYALGQLISITLLLTVSIFVIVSLLLLCSAMVRLVVPS